MLEGKTVAMTGGGGGLGRCYGVAWRKRALSIAVSDIDLEAAQSDRRRDPRGGRQGDRGAADVTQAAEFEQLLDRTESELGPLDVLLNIAGMFPRERSST